jgi:hypothetical protein
VKYLDPLIDDFGNEPARWQGVQGANDALVVERDQS